MLNNIHPRTIRPDADGRVTARYVKDRHYCSNPLDYIRAARVIAKDLDRLFDFVEPSNLNLETHSFEILGLFTRVCFEVEANLKGILLANEYSIKSKRAEPKELRMKHYWKTEQSHYLSRYRILFPQWSGGRREFRPFEAWAAGNTPLTWFESYNHLKHDRSRGFREANLENLCLSFAGLIALLSSQFWREDTTIKEFGIFGGKSLEAGDFDQSLVPDYWFKIDPEFGSEDRYNIAPGTKEFLFSNFKYN